MQQERPEQPDNAAAEQQDVPVQNEPDSSPGVGSVDLSQEPADLHPAPEANGDEDEEDGEAAPKQRDTSVPQKGDKEAGLGDKGVANPERDTSPKQGIRNE